MYSKAVVQNADSETFTKCGRARSGAKPNSFEHCSNEVCYCVELTCDPPPRAHRTSQGRELPSSAVATVASVLVSVAQDQKS